MSIEVRKSAHAKIHDILEKKGNEIDRTVRVYIKGFG